MTTPDEKYELITRGLAEVLGGDSIKAILAEGRAPKAYWGAFIVIFHYDQLDLWMRIRKCTNRKTYVYTYFYLFLHAHGHS